MSDSQLSAAERRRQRILAKGSDRLGKITNMYTSTSSSTAESEIAPSNTVTSSSPSQEPAAAAVPTTSELPTWTVPGDYRPTPRSALPQARSPTPTTPTDVNSPPTLSSKPSLPTRSSSSSLQQDFLQKPQPKTGLSVKKLVFGLIRISVIAFTVYLAVALVTQYASIESKANEFSWDYSEDAYVQPEEPVLWNGFDISSLAALSKKNMSVDIPVNIFGLHFSIWILFVVYELIRQGVRFAAPEFAATPPAPPAATQASAGMLGSVLSMASGFASSFLGGASRQLGPLAVLRSIWQSLNEDVGLFIVGLGLIVAASSWYVETKAQEQQSGGEL
ncbi:hypothetical protein HDU84_003239 [Entophlyctis sp. JEL0112]|nr:hypothetical protein HDU84_003239 [Entophlyctis sp. JEL0112]